MSFNSVNEGPLLGNGTSSRNGGYVGESGLQTIDRAHAIPGLGIEPILKIIVMDHMMDSASGGAKKKLKNQIGIRLIRFRLGSGNVHQMAVFYGFFW